MKSALALLPVLMMACGGPADRADRSASNAPSGASELPELGAAYRAPSGAMELSSGALEFALEAIALATNLAGDGTLRDYGTLTEAQDGSVSYQSSPSERLVVDRPGVHLELALLEVNGAGSDVASFLRGTHSARARYLVSDQLTGEVWSSREGSRRQAGLAGRVLLEGRWWDADLLRIGTESFDNDQSGSRFFDDHELTGVLEAEGARIDVSQRWTFEMVSARGTGSRTEVASSAVRVAGDTATLDGDEFAWDDARTQKAFRDGKPTELDTFWQASGRITQAGAPFGEVQMFVSPVGGESGGFVGFEIQTSEGAIELERHQAY